MKNKKTLQDSSLPEKNNTVPFSQAGSPIDRRKFVEVMSAGALAFTILPRHVLGGKNYTAPSDMISLAYIGWAPRASGNCYHCLQTRNYRSLRFVIPIKKPLGIEIGGKII